MPRSAEQNPRAAPAAGEAPAARRGCPGPDAPGPPHRPAAGPASTCRSRSCRRSVSCRLASSLEHGLAVGFHGRLAGSGTAWIAVMLRHGTVRAPGDASGLVSRVDQSSADALRSPRSIQTVLLELVN